MLKYILHILKRILKFTAESCIEISLILLVAAIMRIITAIAFGYIFSMVVTVMFIVGVFLALLVKDYDSR